jgi:hypothetical protein
MSADLGSPILLFILIFWLFLTLVAILTTIFGRENRKSLKQYIHHLLDTSSIHQTDPDKGAK